MSIPTDDCVPGRTTGAGAFSDDPTVNNKGRHQYRVLSDEEKRIVHTIKDVGANFCGYIDALLKQAQLPSGSGPALDPRCAALAKTKMEEAVMWAVRGLTK